jgi:hypothetical protein
MGAESGIATDVVAQFAKVQEFYVALNLKP